MQKSDPENVDLLLMAYVGGNDLGFKITPEQAEWQRYRLSRPSFLLVFFHARRVDIVHFCDRVIVSAPRPDPGTPVPAKI